MPWCAKKCDKFGLPSLLKLKCFIKSLNSYCDHSQLRASSRLVDNFLTQLEALIVIFVKIDSIAFT